jgi:hypothetical protein
LDVQHKAKRFTDRTIPAEIYQSTNPSLEMSQPIHNPGTSCQTVSIFYAAIMSLRNVVGLLALRHSNLGWSPVTPGYWYIIPINQNLLASNITPLIIKSATGYDPGPVPSTSHSNSLFPTIHFNIIFPSPFWFSMTPLSKRISN